ncbi:MAG: hypothetical protein IMW93_06635 [Thermoanaerobacteraceae bacterium]|nr:hypothetical protein [Thermoanaerobacteraceae bacterium]
MSQRYYPQKDLKILLSLAAGRCAFPGCRLLCVKEGTGKDGPVFIGHIAHIHSHSDDGPRADQSLLMKERDCYENSILLCPNHHTLVDSQPNTYTADILRSWKTKHEEWVAQQLSENIRKVSFDELEVVCKAIIRNPGPPSKDFALVDPREKMLRNGLTEKVYFLLTLGLGKAREVERFIKNIALLDSDFPERLRAGFVSEYHRLKVEQGFEGDALFTALQEFASGGYFKNFERVSAGLAVLAYLFEKCEVFEK